jgi:hypothetical protein
MGFFDAIKSLFWQSYQSFQPPVTITIPEIPRYTPPGTYEELKSSLTSLVNTLTPLAGICMAVNGIKAKSAIIMAGRDTSATWSGLKTDLQTLLNGLYSIDPMCRNLSQVKEQVETIIDAVSKQTTAPYPYYYRVGK